MVVAAAAMFYAAAIESWRLSVFRDMHGGSNSGGPSLGPALADGAGGAGGGGQITSPERVPINIMWQAPAYILVGASEVLASVGQLEFFYDQVRSGDLRAGDLRSCDLRRPRLAGNRGARQDVAARQGAAL